jgi:hypothetical protein
MQELGVWSTASGTTEAFLDFESDDSGIHATELPSWATSAIQGAVAGAATGAAGGPIRALIGAATGGALGAASSAATPAPASNSAASGPATQPADANRAKINQALQQLAAIMPVLVQFLAASGKRGKEVGLSSVDEGSESLEASDWGPEAFEGRWTVP